MIDQVAEKVVRRVILGFLLGGLLLGGGLALWLFWIVGTWLGLYMGNAIADPVRWGLDMVMGCFLLTMVVDGRKDRRLVAIWAMAAGSSRQASSWASRPRTMPSDRALSALGRFKVIKPTWPRTSHSSSVVCVMVWCLLGLAQRLAQKMATIPQTQAGHGAKTVFQAANNDTLNARPRARKPAHAAHRPRRSLAAQSAGILAPLFVFSVVLF